MSENGVAGYDSVESNPELTEYPPLIVIVDEGVNAVEKFVTEVYE
jgi:hypothetical protein